MLIVPRLGRFPIRYKILSALLAVFIPFALLTGALAYSLIQRALEAHIQSELGNTSQTVRNMVQTSVRLSIRSYLRSVAETNLQMVRGLYGKFQAGEITEEEARRQAVFTLLGQKIGKSGYLYCVTSDGTAVVHPDPKVQGQNFATTSFVVEQISKKDGYIEYEWKNPDEDAPRGKALSMAYFAPWDWIISATAYREEFGALVNVDDFSANVEALKFGGSGYTYILDLNGNLIIHPVYEGQNAFDIAEGDKEFLRDMISSREGQRVYSWRNPREPEPREKIVVYDFIPEVQWIVASSAYLDDLYAPLVTFRDNSTIMAGVFVLFGIILAFRVSSSITDPVTRLAKRLSVGEEEPGPETSRDEVERLASLFDRFMERLELETSERQLAENRLRSSQERYRAVMEAAPDPIMVLDMKGRAVYLNCAFTRIFDYSLNDALPLEESGFVGPDEKERTFALVTQLLEGETIGGVETVRFTRAGLVRHVSISGGPFRDGGGAIAGSIMILRDISEFKRMEREVINADEHERIRIGQDLHDDLGPHLIGIGVLCQVLKRKLDQGAPAYSADAEKIHKLVGEATGKTRALARGLSPVHLADEGLEMGLTQLLEMVELIFGINCTLRWEGTPQLDTTTSVHLYRIVQEALHNAAKHANAEHIDVFCHTDRDQTVIEVTDDGIGLVYAPASNGMGMKIMAFRAQMIGGTLDISSTHGGGTSVKLSMRSNQQPQNRRGLDGSAALGKGS